MTDFFQRLPLFLKEYIYSRHWADFTEAQKESFEVLFDHDEHLLLSAGTSSGKTEAAMFPVLSSLYTEPVHGIGALYIGPLKALINDQNDRLSEMLRQSELTVSSWHGDVSSAKKAKIRENPQGILQITPESLQALIINHPEALERMFENLRFVVIDEVHTFMNSTRGLQLLCELKMISEITGCNPRRIGLSATMSDMEPAERWLGADTERPVKTVTIRNTSNYTVQIHYHHFPEAGSEPEPRKVAIGRYYEDLFRETDQYNCIVFANSRLGAENTTNSLRKISARKGSQKNIDIHHGSISQELRHNAEDRMKNSGFRNTTIATTTLELGIDVGDLDRIVQIDPPYSCSSFVQRMGRSGRRTGRPYMSILCTDDDDKFYDHPLGFPVNLIKAVALVELYHGERWVEPIRHSRKPFGLLFQQILAYVHARPNAGMTNLRKNVGGMYAFREIEQTEFDELVRSMFEKNLLGEVDGLLYVETKGGKIVCSHDFYATFSDDNDYEVKCGDKRIGFLSKCPKAGDSILLAGTAWVVQKAEGREIQVESVSNDAITRWGSGIPDVHTRVIRKMRDILASEDDYSYLDEQARLALCESRRIARESGILETFSQESANSIRITPWLGSIQFDSLVRLLKADADVKVLSTCPPFSITVRTGIPIPDLRRRMTESAEITDPQSLLESYDQIYRDKFDGNVPADLLRKTFALDRIDLNIELDP